MEKIANGTPDITQENIDKIAELFPDCITEVLDENGTLKRAIDFDALKGDLSSEVAEGTRERYQFTWPGKAEAKFEARKPCTKTMRPCPGESVNWDTTENLYIEGDNLEALKIMRETYAGTIDVIYIDPPYNTGGDLIYDDDFSKDSDEFFAEEGSYDEYGNRMVANLESNGKFHSDWCSMVYPRLLLARDYLAPDGAIFVSIDEGESDNLRKILDSVFGEKNFITQFTWAAGRKNDSQLVSISHEYIFCYAKSLQYLKDEKIRWRERKQGLEDIYAAYESFRKSFGTDNERVQEALKAWYKSLSDDHPAKNHSHYSSVDDRGIYFPDNISWPGGGGPKYEVLHPITHKPVKVPSRGWLYGTPERMQELIDQDLIEFGPDESKVPCVKGYLKDHEYSAPYSVFYKDGRAASKRLATLMGDKVFDNPKDEEILKRLIMLCGKKDVTVMDFFSGSGTIAQAVFEANQEDGGIRHCILVQIPEDLDENLARTSKQSAKQVLENAINLCDELKQSHKLTTIAKERIRRAGVKVAAEVEVANKQLQLGEEPKTVPDIGFRVLKIDSSNFRETYLEPEELEQGTLDLYVDNLKEDRTAEDLLFQVLPAFRIPYSAKIETFEAAGKTVYDVNEGQLLACFDESVDVDTIEEIAKRKPVYAVLRDASLKDDATEANFEELFKTYSPDTVRRVI